MHRPGPLKVRSRPVPYLGDIAVFAGLAVPLLWTRPAALVPIGLAMALGLADDVGDLHSGLRFASELAIGGSVAVVAGVAAPLIVIAALAMVLLINAVNLLDGLDGLASGTAVASSVGVAFVLGADFALWPRRLLRLSAASALESAAGFHLSRRRRQLPDRCRACSPRHIDDRSDGSLPAAAAAALLVGVPVADTSIAVMRRWRAKRPLFSGDRGHVYDQLVDRKWSPERATLACIAARGALALVAIGVGRLPSGVAVAVAIATVAGVAAWAVPTFTSPASSAR